MGLFKKKFRSIKKFPTWVFWPLATLMKFMKLCMRTDFIDPHNAVNYKTPLVTVTWHNRLLFFPVMFPLYVRKKTMAVVSASRDGQYVTDLLAHFKLKSLRGSSSRKGANALRGAIDAINAGYNVSFTPDGPRGPKYSMSQGPILTASKTGVEIVPVSVNASAYWQIKSWDNFQIPKPWAKLTLIIGDPIKIPADMSEEELEQYREKVRQALLDITVDRN
ncbi:MAG: lysophospholipid acyltransferase family protein [Victivallales bacterium]|nr:lysophospholipid acyltransferase family protein [Victivallales bacterium]